jgi:hypothetical protein
MTQVYLGEIKVRVEDVNYSDYYPLGSYQCWGPLDGFTPPKRAEPMLTLEMKNNQRYRFEGSLADCYLSELEEAGVPVFRHES